MPIYCVIASILLLQSPSVPEPLPPHPTGAVIESIGLGSPLEAAGVKPGFIITSWKQRDAGMIRTIFDWLWLESENAPRGPLIITAITDQGMATARVGEGKWATKARPFLDASLLALYNQGQQLIHDKLLREGILLWEKLANLAAPEDSSETRAWIKLRIGDAWSEKQQWEEALESYNSALTSSRTHKSRVSILVAIGALHFRQNHLTDAEHTYREALTILHNKSPRSLTLAQYQTNFSITLSRQGKTEEAEKFFKEALSIQRKLGPRSLPLANTLTGLGQAAWSRGNPGKAKTYFDEALAIRQRLAPGTLELAASLNNLGNVFFDQGNLEKAEDLFRESLLIKEKIAPQGAPIALSLNNLGNVSFERGDYAAAEQHHKRALAIWNASNPGGPEAAATLHNLGNSAYERGDQELAEQYYR